MSLYYWSGVHFLSSYDNGIECCKTKTLKYLFILRWFQGFDWEGLAEMTLQPPFRRVISSPSDKSNFDHYASEIEQPPDELSGWDEDFWAK